MNINNIDGQIYIFLCCVAVGCILALIYAVANALIQFAKGKLAKFVNIVVDVAYVGLLGLGVVVSVRAFNNGFLTVYMVVGYLLGFIFTYKLTSKLLDISIVRLYNKINLKNK